MADAAVVTTEVEQKKPDGTSGKTDNPKMWSDDDVKVIIAERDKAKEKARKYDDDKKKAEEAKAIEEGRLKEVLEGQKRELEELRAYKTQRDEAEKLEREELMGKIKDDKDKEIATDLPSVDLVRKYVEKIESQTGGPSPARGAKAATQDANPYKALEGETYTEWQRRRDKLKNERSSKR